MPACPTCPSATLRHTLLADGLPAHGCDTCGGVLLSLVTYRGWRDGRAVNASAAVEQLPAAAPVPDHAEAIRCPKCERIMTKYRIGEAVGNRLDYCAHCEELWLDGGEWALVEALAASGQLAAVVTQPWQRRVRAGDTARMEAARIHELLGTQYPTYRALVEWLDAHPARDLMLAQLAGRWRDAPPADPLRDALGPDYAQVDAFRDWLDEHEERSSILAYLHEGGERESGADRHARTLASVLGDDYTRFTEARQWLQAHTARDQILALLRRRYR